MCSGSLIFKLAGDTADSQYHLCLKKPLTAGRPGREEVRDSPGL